MKMNKKKLAVVSLVLCIVAVISLGSLAWFTATDTVTNTLNFVTDFQMDLYETNDDGTMHTVNNDTIGRTYGSLVPNQLIHKDPTVINKSSSEAQWIRMSVTVDKTDVWGKYVAQGADLTSIFKGFDATHWKLFGTPTTSGTSMTYTYILDYALPAGATATLFTGVQIPSGITVADASSLNGATIVVKAEALQVSELGKSTCKEAFELYDGE